MIAKKTLISLSALTAVVLVFYIWSDKKIKAADARDREMYSAMPSGRETDAAQASLLQEQRNKEIAECKKYRADCSNDPAACVKKQKNITFSRDYFAGKAFVNISMSGEWGSFNKDGSLPTSWRLDYGGENDKRPRSGTGRWEFKAGVLSISSTAISDAEYNAAKDFETFSFNKEIFLAPSSGGGIFIGPDVAKTEEFYKNLELSKCRW